ncbi:hypothetical protein [Enterococcus sp. C76]
MKKLKKDYGALFGLVVVGSEWNQSPTDLSETFHEVHSFLSIS